jgi:hypothetical protein
VVVMVFVGIMNRPEVVFHSGRDPGHSMVLEDSQADRGGQPIGQDGRKETGDAAVLCRLAPVSRARGVRPIDLDTAGFKVEFVAGVGEPCGWPGPR